MRVWRATAQVFDQRFVALVESLLWLAVGDFMPMTKHVLLAVALFFPLRTVAAPVYLVSIDQSLASVDIEVTGLSPGSGLRAYTSHAARSTEFLDCDTGARLRFHGRTIRVPNGKDCLRYSISLRNDARTRYIPRGGEVRVTRINDWLWFPTRQRSDMRVKFFAPKSIEVSVPWQPQADSSYRIARSPRSGAANAAFGKLNRHDINIDGAVLRVAHIGSITAQERDRLRAWLSSAARNVAKAYGIFPNPSVQVLLFDTHTSRGSPVPFGAVVRNQGESVRFYVDGSRSLKDLNRDWTATHEFAHLLLPYIDDRWVSEGFASYFQNVLLARGGVYSETDAWSKLRAGFERGRLSAPQLSPQAASHTRGATMKMYWAGAVLALRADLKIREISHSRKSLNTVLKGLQACCLPAQRSYSAAEVFLRLDQMLPEAVFMPLYREYAHKPGFPDYQAAFETLGVREVRGRVRLSQDDEAARLRESITAPISRSETTP